METCWQSYTGAWRPCRAGGHSDQRGGQPGARTWQGSPRRVPLGQVTCSKTWFSQLKNVCTEPQKQKMERFLFTESASSYNRSISGYHGKGMCMGQGTSPWRSNSLLMQGKTQHAATLRNRVISSPLWSCSRREQGFGSPRSPCGNSIPLKAPTSPQLLMNNRMVTLT